MFDWVEFPITVQPYLPSVTPEPVQLDSPQAFKIDAAKLSPNLYGILEHLPVANSSPPRQMGRSACGHPLSKTVNKKQHPYIDFRLLKQHHRKIKALLPGHARHRNQLGVSGRRLVSARTFAPHVSRRTTSWAGSEALFKKSDTCRESSGEVLRGSVATARPGRHQPLCMEGHSASNIPPQRSLHGATGVTS